MLVNFICFYFQKNLILAVICHIMPHLWVYSKSIVFFIFFHPKFANIIAYNINTTPFLNKTHDRRSYHDLQWTRLIQSDFKARSIRFIKCDLQWTAWGRLWRLIVYPRKPHCCRTCVKDMYNYKDISIHPSISAPLVLRFESWSAGPVWSWSEGKWAACYF